MVSLRSDNDTIELDSTMSKTHCGKLLLGVCFFQSVLGPFGKDNLN